MRVLGTSKYLCHRSDIDCEYPGGGSAIAQHVTEMMRGHRWARLVGVVGLFSARTQGGGHVRCWKDRGHVRCWKDLRGSDVRRGLARAESCEETPVGAARWTAIP